jgi:hypothetical protein
MVRKGEADIPRLQAMLEEDIYAYEEEMGLFVSAGSAIITATMARPAVTVEA